MKTGSHVRSVQRAREALGRSSAKSARGGARGWLGPFLGSVGGGQSPGLAPLEPQEQGLGKDSREGRERGGQGSYVRKRSQQGCCMQQTLQDKNREG